MSHGLMASFSHTGDIALHPSVLLMLVSRPGLSFWCIVATLATAFVVLPDNALSQGTPSQRRLTVQGTVSPLDQYRMLMQLQRATQQANAEELKKKLGLNDQQLKKLSEVFNQPGGLYQSNLPSKIKQLALEHPEVIERAVEIQQQLQRLQQDLPDVAPPAKPNTPPQSPVDKPPGAPDDPEASTQQDSRRSENSPMRQVPNRRPTSPSSQRTPSDAPTSAERRHRSLPDTFEDLLKHAPGATRGTESSAAGPLAAGPGERSNAEAAARQPGNAPGSALPSNLSRELEKHGVRNMVKRLVENARQEAGRTDTSRSATENDDPSTSIWNRTIASAVDLVRDDVVNIVDERRRQRRTQRGTNSPTSDSRFRPRSEQQRNAGSKQTAERATASGVSAESALSPLSFDDALPQLPEDISAESVFPFLLGAGLLIACLLLASRHRSLVSTTQTDFRNIPIKPKDIRSREDVILAYHWLTEATAPDFAKWWHHRRAQKTMVEYSPERSDAIREFAGLYELARYDSNDKSFGEDRIQQARDALAGCLA